MTTKISGTQVQTGAIGATQLASTAVTPASYGSSTKSAVITIDADGRITAASEANITGSGGLPPDGDYGDITVSASGAAWAIDSGVVTNAKLATIVTDSIKGRATAGTGAVEDLTALPFAFTGDVTRPADSNVQTLAAGSASNLNSGTLPAGRMPALTGDVTTVAGAVASTIANDAVTYAKMQNVSAASKLLGRGDSGSGDVQEITLGSGLSMSGTTISSSGGGGGAPTDAEYITSASDGTLSAEVVIPGLAGSADRKGVAGAGTSEEYDTSTTGLTWSPSTPSVVDSDTTIPSHLYVESNDSTERFGTKAWTPAGAFDVRCKVELGSFSASQGSVGLHIQNADNSVRLLINWGLGNLRGEAVAFTYESGTYSQRGDTWQVGASQCYFRIVRDAGNNISFYWSSTGNTWVFIATQAVTITPTKLGFRSANNPHAGAFDWLRTSV